MQNRSNIHFVDNINLAFLARMFRMSADDDTLYQFITHFTGKLESFEIFLYVPYMRKALEETIPDREQRQEYVERNNERKQNNVRDQLAMLCIL